MSLKKKEKMLLNTIACSSQFWLISTSPYHLNLGPMFPFVLKEMGIPLYIVVELFVQLYSPTKVKTQTEGKKLDFMTLAPA